MLNKSLFNFSLALAIFTGSCSLPPTANNTEATKANNFSIKSGDLFEDAREMTEEEFHELAGGHETVTYSPELVDNAMMEYRRKIELAKEKVNDFLAHNPEEGKIFEDIDSSLTEPLDDGNLLYHLKTEKIDQKVTLMGTDWNYLTYANTLETNYTRENQIAIYTMAYKSLSDNGADIRRFPEPFTLEDKTVEEISSYNVSLVKAHEKHLAKATGGLNCSEPGTEEHGSGPNNSDKNISINFFDPMVVYFYSQYANGQISYQQFLTSIGLTPSSTGIFNNFSFSQKNYLTSVKNQGARGTCVAFSVASAKETLLARRDQQCKNLSEQDYYYTNKWLWDYTVYGDGLVTYHSVLKTINNNYKFKNEADWEYNPSNGRTDTGSSYSNSCTNYSGFCSDTNHQGLPIFIPNLNWFLYLAQPLQTNNADIHGVSAELLNVNNREMSMMFTKVLVNNNVPVVASLPIKTNFANATNNDGFMILQPANHVGYHAVHVTGFIDNLTLHSILPNAPWAPADPLNNSPMALFQAGFFIVKNSWGPGHGDGGYVYIPDFYMKYYSTSLVGYNY